MGLRLHGYSCFPTGGLLHLSFTCDSEPLEVAPPPQWDGASGRESSASPSRVAGSEVFVVCVHAVCMPCACHVVMCMPCAMHATGVLSVSPSSRVYGIK